MRQHRDDHITDREKFSGEHDAALALREEAVQLREEMLDALSESDAARSSREHMIVQMREANERLVIATMHADELMERAVAAHALAAESASFEQASGRAKDAFLAMLAHELRGPLSPILLALDLIQMDGDDPRKREHTIIERQVNQLVRLVDDLLDVARIQSGKVELVRQPIQIADAVSRAVEVASPMIHAKRHTLTVEVPDGLGVDGDVLRLTQVVGNLLTNAAKYTSPGGSIAVTGERRDAYIRLRVRDDGIGISETMIPRVFDLFAQEAHATELTPGGLGLGLSIVRSLVAMHGGTVTAHSAGIGHGSEFTIELPASTAVGASVA